VCSFDTNFLIADSDMYLMDTVARRARVPLNDRGQSRP
jgi:hypothetical protein